jgi:CubicO group peptidase (beta-lactamase class C family)
MRARLWSSALLLGLFVLAGPLRADSTAPQSQHPTFSPAAIATINKQMHSLVDDRHAAPGIVTMIVQRGKTLDLDAYGFADTEKKTPMRADSVLAIASMTKPLTGVAMMILYEQGKWSLDDPVAKFVPAFKDLKVMGSDGKLVPPNHAPTMRELMSHSAGFTYGFFGNSDVDKQYQQANVLDANSSLATAVGKIARLPLKHQPGTKWEYSVSVDIQGYIIEKLSGQPYDVFVREHIVKPLKLKDTDFAVFGAARERMALPHSPAKDGGWSVALPPNGREGFANKVPGLPSPGGGAFSTAPDYARFCQMLLNGGTLDGVRLLKPATVGLMHTNMLPKGLHVGILNDDLAGTGFGLDFAVVEDAALSHEPVPTGTFYWSGIYGTYFWIDPANDLVVVGMIQRAWSPTGADASYDPVFVRNEGAKIIYAALGH